MLTYSFTVTILLIIFVTLLIANMRAGIGHTDYMQRKYSEKSAEVDTLIRKGCRLVEDKDILKRHNLHLEERNADLLERIDGKSQLIMTQRDRMKFLRKENNELRDEILLTSTLQHVRFTAVLPSGIQEKTTFKLGLGPCGLNVSSLKWTELEDRYLIDQLCTNGDRKQFTYFKSDVVGRIEFKHGETR